MGVRAEHQVHPARRPLDITRGSILTLEQGLGVVRGLPRGAHVQHVDEVVVGQLTLAFGQDPDVGAIGIGADNAHPRHQHGHFRGRQAEQVGLVDHQLLCGPNLTLGYVVAHAIGGRLQGCEGLDVRHLLGRVGASRSERHRDRVTGRCRRTLDTGGTTEHDEVRHGDLRATSRVELRLDTFQGAEHLGEVVWVVHGPLVLRFESNASAVRATTLVGSAERGSRRPGRLHKVGSGEARRVDHALQRGRVSVGDQVRIWSRNRVLPDQALLGNFGTEVAHLGSHVSVGQFEPGASERIRELLRVLQELSGDRLVDRIGPQRDVRGEHDRCVAGARIVSIGNGVG